MTWVLDLDGVVWLLDRAIPGAAAAIATLRAGGDDVLFVTNNAANRVGDVAGRLAAMGIEADEAAIVTSAAAAATLLSPGERVLVCGGAGLWEAVERSGALPRRDGPADTVVVGWHRDFDFDRLTAAHRAITAGARFVATNTDVTYPTSDGTLPGNGAIVAAVAASTGRVPVVAGKPHAPMVELVQARAAARGGRPGYLVVVGDRPDTDGALAGALGARFVLVLTGVSTDGDVEPRPDVVATDLAEAVRLVTGQ